MNVKTVITSLLIDAAETKGSNVVSGVYSLIPRSSPSLLLLAIWYCKYRKLGEDLGMRLGLCICDNISALKSYLHDLRCMVSQIQCISCEM